MLGRALRTAPGPGQDGRTGSRGLPVLKYDGQVVEALRVCWATLDGATGKRLAPALPELVASLRRHGELDVDDQTAALLVAMSPATIDRRLVADRPRCS